jgi:hypothetical protein
MWIDCGLLVEDGFGDYVFTEDVVVGSRTKAASIVAGYRTSTKWTEL